MVHAMSSIMTAVLEEKVVDNSSELLSSEGKVSEPLLDVILQNLLKETKVSIVIKFILSLRRLRLSSDST